MSSSMDARATLETELASSESLMQRGMQVRREVLGAAHVDRSMAGANDFTMAMQELTTQWCWGAVWTRPGLDRKTRSLLNIAMLTALNRIPELRVHVRGALTNGATAEEIKEVLLQSATYCGVPAGLEGFRAANEVILATDDHEAS